MPKRLGSKEVIRVLQEHGFSFVTQRGSHAKYKNAAGLSRCRIKTLQLHCEAGGRTAATDKMSPTEIHPVHFAAFVRIAEFADECLQAFILVKSTRRLRRHQRDRL